MKRLSLCLCAVFLFVAGCIPIDIGDFGAYDFSNGLAPARQGNRWGYVNGEGQWEIYPRFDRAWTFSDGRALVLHRGKKAYIDEAGKIVFTPRAFMALHFSEGLVQISRRSFRDGRKPRWGYMNRQGKLIIPAIYEDAEPFSEGMALVTQQENRLFIDPVGNKVFECGVSEVWNFRNGRARFYDAGGYGYFDRKGRKIIPPDFVSAQDFSEGLAVVARIERQPEGRMRRRYFFIDKDGGKTYEAEADEVSSFSEGLARFRVADNWGFLNRKGVEVIAPSFKFVGDFHDGRALFRENGLHGYIDHKGDVVIKPSYLLARDYSDGRALVKTSKGHSYIDLHGNIVWTSDSK